MTRLLHNSFDPYKAAEVAFLFLSAAGEGSAQISKFRLMKCMYLAERKSYERYAEPMIGDMPCSMQHGPALVSILEFLRSPDGTTPGHQTWNSVVAVGKVGSQKYLSLNNDCPFKTVNDLRKMSDSEINLVLEIDEEFRHMSAVKMGQSIRRHLMCSEWK